MQYGWLATPFVGQGEVVLSAKTIKVFKSTQREDAE
jgi:hypothetical protein